MEFKGLNDLFEFMRVKLCVFSMFIGSAGFLIFNELSFDIVYVMMVSFFTCTGTYAFNNMKDIKEDEINRNKISSFVTERYKGYLVVFLCFMFGFVFSLFLPIFCFLFFVTSTITGIAYSMVKVKRYFLLKNLYTGFGLPQLFLLGSMQINKDVVFYYFLISLFLFISSLISDLRDFIGDRIAGIRTIPVRFGYKNTNIVILALLTLFFVLIIQTLFFPLSFFVMIMIVSLIRNKPKLAHLIGGTSLVFLTGWIGIISLL